MKGICKKCGKETGRLKNCKYCLECVKKIDKESCHKWYLKNRDMVLKKMKDKYQKKTTYKLCLFCGKKFIATRTKKYCDRECRKKYLDIHKLENREKRKKYENMPKVKEKRREYDRKYFKDNKEKFKKKFKRYYSKNKEKISIRNKKKYHKCLGCDNLIVPKAKRCSSCAMKERKKKYGFIQSTKVRKIKSKIMKINNPMKNPKIAKKVRDLNKKNGYQKQKLRNM